eukprot:2623851-Prymnesium_polylepis.2
MSDKSVRAAHVRREMLAGVHCSSSRGEEHLRKQLGVAVLVCEPKHTNRIRCPLSMWRASLVLGDVAVPARGFWKAEPLKWEDVCTSRGNRTARSRGA